MMNLRFTSGLIFLLTLSSCAKVFIKQDSHFPSNKAWSITVFNLMEQEASLNENDCPDLKSFAPGYSSFLKQSDFENSLLTLDSLKRTGKNFDQKDEFVLVHSIQEGFNFWQCTSYMIAKRRKRELSGFEFCKIYVDPYSEKETPDYTIKPINEKYKDLKTYWALTTDCNLPGAIVITLLDNNLNIKRIHVALMPSPRS